jgi:SAM-dependent methyltransferase
MATPSLQALYADQYHRAAYLGPRWYQILRQWVVDREQLAARLVPGPVDSWLDIGCGEGRLLTMVQPRVKKLLGTDLVAERIKKANQVLRKSSSTIEVMVYDLDAKLPWRTNSISVVSLLSVLEYTIDPYLVIQDIHRVLKPGGMFIIEVPNLAYLFERWRLLRGQLVGCAHAPGWQGGRLHHFTFTTLEKLLTDNGFVVEKRMGSGFLYKVRSFYPSLLSSDIVLVAKKR